MRRRFFSLFTHTPLLTASIFALILGACGGEDGADANEGKVGIDATSDAGATLDGESKADGGAAGVGDVAEDAGLVCKAGESKCGAGAAATRLVCKADGSGWTEEICSGLNATCDKGVCLVPDAGQTQDSGTSSPDAGSVEQDVGGTSDVGTDPCGGMCGPKQKCVGGICEDIAPCGGKCPKGTKCVEDSCVPIPCGGPCPKGQFCDAKADGGKGKCFTPTCIIPSKWGPNLQKISLFKLKPQGQGCDLDGDGKADNAMGISMVLNGINNFFADEMVKGDRVTFLQADDPKGSYKTDGSLFDITLLTGSIDASNKSCDKTKAGCKYTIGKWNYDFLSKGPGACPPVAFWAKASAKDKALKAGNDNQALDAWYPFEGDAFSAHILAAHISGTTDDSTTWKTTKSGMLCGVITQKEIFELIDAIPESQLGGLKKTDIKSMLPSFIKADIDTTGDGKKDAYSAAFDFESVGAEIVGIQ